MDTEKTKVIFRQWPNGDVIAMFPEIAVDTVGFNCQSYMHVGQHGAASPSLVQDTKPADMKDKAVINLIAELEKIGYNLEVIKRFRYEHQKIRMAMYQ